MFLVTTALEKYWDTSKKILFLGEWCKLYSRKHIWEKLEYEVMPYHWDDREKLYYDYIYLDGIYERYLKQLAKKLNEIHCVNYSERYWRILIGPWLFYFIEIFFDRYESINNAKNRGDIKQTWITECENDFFTPYDFNDFLSEIINDKYNHLLFSYLIKKIGAIPFASIEKLENNETHSNFIYNINKKKLFFLKLITLYNNIIPQNLKRYVFIGSYLRNSDLFKLQIALGQLPCLFKGYIDKFPEYHIDKKLRKRISFQDSTNEFELLLNELIPFQIPFLYLESYKEYKNRVLRQFPKKSDLIFTANASIIIEAFKFWAAEQSEDGAKLVLTQHGGHHGMGLWSAELKHEITISDIYFTWGWDNKETDKICSMPSGQLYRLKNKFKPKKDGVILWVMMELPRYSYWLYSIPVGPQMLHYFNDQKRFFEKLDKNAKERLLIKPFMNDFGWDNRKRLKDMMPDVRQYEGKKNMKELLKESRLFIGTYNATTYLETFAANFPTILFWNPYYWELKEEVKPYFKLLLDAGILHYTPESAAEKVNKIFNDPMSWWMSEDIQSAKNIFCKRFALIDDNWIHIWNEELKTIVVR